MPGPRLEVGPPSFVSGPYGLLSVAQTRYDATDDHWRNGVTYRPVCSLVTGAGGALTYDDLCIPTGMPAKVATASVVNRAATPFTVFAEIDCSPVGGFWDEAKAQTSEMLTRSEPWQVERAFWTGGNIGGVTNYPHLAANTVFNDPAITTSTVLLQSAATTVTGTADIVEGIGILEKLLADCYDGVGVIHIPAQAVAHLASRWVLKDVGGKLYTPNGNLIAAGNGYPGTAPDGSAPAAGTSWIYATGQVFVYRSPIIQFRQVEMLDRSENTMKIIAERTYVLGWDCCHFGILVSLGGVITGTQGSAT